MKDKGRAGPTVSATLVRLYKWIVSHQDDGIAGAHIAYKAALQPGSDVIEIIAESLIDNARGAERKLVSKSLQEMLFYCVDFATEIDFAQFKARFSRHLNRHGAASIVQRFLSLYFFNFVWFHTGESFRALADSSDSFAKDIESVERVCQEVVTSVWKSLERPEKLVDVSVARGLVRSIERHLRGK